MPGLQNSRHARPPRNPEPPRGRSLDPSTTSSRNPPSLAITPAAALAPDGGGRSSTATPLPTASPTSHAHAAVELNRYTKIVRRLKWKLPFLSQGYQAAVGNRPDDAAAAAEAELMFKMDFFDYYMLLERALVHLLGVFGITVTRGGSGDGARLPGSRWQHRYHANVLAALDKRDNPLHGVLGTGEVRTQLGRAKDLRNRWKTAGEEEDDRGGGSSPRKTAPLESYDLERILACIFDGFDRAFGVAEDHVRAEGGAMDLDEEAAAAVGATEEEQWEFMVDAMDWEAV